MGVLLLTRIKEIIKIPKSVRNFLILIIVAFLIKTTILEIYVVPTGSMLDTIEINDVIIGNKFIYGLRTPNWIGIPFTRMGTYIPSARLPAFKEVDNGDIVIFEFPNDDYVKYVKRCIGLPGQFVEMRDGEIFLSDSESNEPSFQYDLTYPPKSRFTKERETALKGFSEKSLLDILKMAHNPPFSYYQPISLDNQPSVLNQDNMKFKVPHKGMKINLADEKTDFYSSLMLLLLDGHTVEIQDFEIQENQYSIKMDPNEKYTFHKYDYASMASTSVTISDFFTKATKGTVGIAIFIFIIVLIILYKDLIL